MKLSDPYRPDISEADWKCFKAVHAIAVQRYADRCLQEVQTYLADKTASAAERYFQIRDGINKREKDRRRLFDASRRSIAVIQLAMMRAEKLVTDDEMDRFSDELRQRVEQSLSIVDREGLASQRVE